MSFFRELTSADPEAAAFNPPAPVACEYCGALRYTKGVVMAGRAIWRHDPTPCECAGAQEALRKAKEAEREAELAQERREAAERKAHRAKKAKAASSLGARFQTRTFETFRTTDNPAAARAKKWAQTYAEKFEALKTDDSTREKNGLLFTGAKGTGKTHLAAAIANKLMQRGEPVIFSTMVDLLQALKDSYDRGGEEGLLKLYKKVDLLIIDDLGKERPTEWTAAKIYQIINARYEDLRPIIVTTNYSLEELVDRMTPKGGDKITADATVDRIKEMTHELAFAGESQR